MDHHTDVTRLWLVVVSLCLAACVERPQDGPHFLELPQVEQNPNPTVPLAAILSFSAESADSTSVELRDGLITQRIDFDRIPTPADPLPLLGLKPDREYDIRITIADSGGNTTRAEALTYRTPALPSDRYRWPRFSVNTSNPEAMEPGFTILSVRRSVLERPQLRTPGQQRFMVGWGLLIGVDSSGDVVWYYESDERIAGIDRLGNGNIIFHLAGFRSKEIDMLGNTVNEWFAAERPQGQPSNSDAIPLEGMKTLHHQPHEMPNGNFISFAANPRELENWYTSEYDPEPRRTQTVMGDTIVEFTRAGEQVWSWNAFDHLDTNQIGYEAFDPYWTTRGFPDTWDWSHGNGVSYDARDDSVIASFKLLDAIVKIDRSSGDIVWIFGDHVGWAPRYRDKLLTPVGDDFRWPWHQHNPRWTHADTLLVFNNNRGQAKPFDGRPQVPYSETRSYSVEYAIDEADMTVRQVWTSEQELSEESCVSFAMSEAHRLPETNNVLEINAQCGPPMLEDVTWDPWDLTRPHMSEMHRGGRVREYTRTDPAEVVFELDFTDPAGVLQWEVYGGFRTPSLYSSAAPTH